MRSLFEKNIDRMRAELTDLKTAQKRGLGTIRFYQKTLTVTLQAYTPKRFKITIAPDGFFPGALEIMGGKYYTIVALTDATERIVTYVSATAATVTFTATATTPIESMEEI